MANTTLSTLTLHKREQSGSTAASAVRKTGNIPGVLYGHGQPPLAIAIDAKAFGEILNSSHKSELIDVSLDGAHDTVMIRALQRHPVSRRVLSADFQRVGRDENVHASLPIVTVGVAHGVKESGGVLDFVTHSIEVSGPADQMPENLRLDVTALSIGHHISAKDLALPDGFKLLSPPDTVIVAIEASRTEKQAEADLSQVAPASVKPEEAPSA